MTNSIFIGILPYSQRDHKDLSQTPLALFQWMNNQVPPGQVVADLNPQDHIVVFPHSRHIMWGFGKLSCHVDLLLAEPRSVHGKYYRLLWWLSRRYSYILCRYPDLSQRYNNVIWFNSAESWVDPGALPPADQQLPRKLCSIIVSAKRDQVGHKLRHQVVDMIQAQGLAVDILGRGYAPFEHKWQGLLPYQYSVIIENAQEPHYFTEKLLDAYICGTIPIYWGTKDIGQYFDVNGMIICNSADEIMQALESLLKQPDLKMQQAVEHNQKLAHSYINQPQRIAEVITRLV